MTLEERREEPRAECLGERTALRSDVLRSSSIQDSVGGGDSAGPAARPDELSLPQSTTGEFRIEERILLLTFVVTSVKFSLKKSTKCFLSL